MLTLEFVILAALILIVVVCTVLALGLVWLHLAAYKGPPTYKPDEELHVPNEWVEKYGGDDALR